MAAFARVVFDIGVDREFDYLIPKSLEGLVRPGARVFAPFRSRRLSAYVVEIREGNCHPGAKELIGVRDRDPVLSEPLLALARWISSYYVCPLDSALRCLLPSGVRAGRGAKMPLFVHLDREMLPGPEPLENFPPRAGKQIRALKLLLSHGGPMSVSELSRRAKISRASLRSLEKKGFLRLLRRRVYRDPWEGKTAVAENHLPPTAAQAGAIAHAGAELAKERFSVMLLHGVTGSGKTEVYLQAIDNALKRGRGAIVLVPEIALTPQTLGRFKARFAENVAVLHSALSGGERLDEWEKLREGKARIAVGARSAVFAPVKNLGLIVVDEEHERSYKQEETPRYHARNVAVMRGKIENATVILGSATPSVESYRNALAGKYALFHLPRRIEDRPLPAVTIVDMREEIRRTGHIAYFSRRLLKAMEDRMEKGEQVILFLNRRGFAPFLSCGRCGYVQKCPNCSVSLTAHAEGGKMICHLCGHEESASSRCPRCRSKGIRFPGIGTQKLEIMVSKLFPGYGVGRMDADSMTAKNAHAEALEAFAKGETRILLGTQMIAKGLHFPNVTLVGVICADTALNFPDFRAAEYTFQLLTQVAGRAGRGDVPGEVIVQTYAPKHPAVIAAGTQDYGLFYSREMPFREELGYPPVRRFVAVTVKGRNGELVKWVSRRLAGMLAARAGRDMDIMGPSPSPIARAKGYYRWQVVIKGDSVPRIGAVLKKALEELKPARDVQIVVDADPITML